jgi:LmbE family N-acetylglucosaminyl deacetylase
MNANYRWIGLTFIACFTKVLFGQSNWYNQQWNDGKVELELKKLMNPKKVLYIAAHPDDENTRLIAYFENVLHVDVAYLSLTNGSGGQNLISEELGYDLGLIREQELYAARRHDGGEQFFTSATDFGYSKTHTETFKKWNKEKILGEVVYRIRAYQPDIIITRFAPYTEGLNRTHGHHTASAILALEAFKLAADKDAYPRQLEKVDTWNTRAIFWNSSWWSYGGKERLDSIAATNPEKYKKLQIESYVDELGLTSSEIASNSRSMHKSQGFGTRPYYGPNFEYLELLDGDGAALDALVNPYIPQTEYEKLLNNARFAKADAIPGFLKQAIMRKMGDEDDAELTRLKDLYLKSIKSRVFVTADQPLLAVGKHTVNISLLHFHKWPVFIGSIRLGDAKLDINQNLEPGVLLEKDLQVQLDDPYQNPKVSIAIDGIRLNIPLVYRTSDPVQGEVIQKVFTIKPVTLTIEQPELISINGELKQTPVFLNVHTSIDSAILHVMHSDTIYYADTLRNLVEGTTITQYLSPPAGKSEVRLVLPNRVQVHKKHYTLKHNHIPWIQVTAPAQLTNHSIMVVCPAKKIGYVAGAGDKVAEFTRSMGVEVEALDYTSVTAEELAQYDAVVFGIRSLNVHEDIDKYLPVFYTYAENGGTLIMQYNTSHRLKTSNLKGLKLSRDRVTEEDSRVIADTNAVVLNKPNTITPKDFEGWVQERGLYFPNSWPYGSVTPLKMADSEGDWYTGSLVIQDLGKGKFVYTGLSFFRELPAGVSGAYKLWANLLSL